jgi:TRAP-type C4-dicarboxylate transport system permease small subunit
MNSLFTASTLYFRALLGLSALAMVATLAVALTTIVARQVGWNVSALDGYSGYLIAAVLFLALPATLQRGEHIRVSMLTDRLPPRLRHTAEVVVLLLALALASFLAFYACKLVWVSFTTDDIAQTMDASKLWIPQLSAAFGCTGLALAFLQALVQTLRGEAFYQRSGEAAKSE